MDYILGSSPPHHFRFLYGHTLKCFRKNPQILALNSHYRWKQALKRDHKCLCNGTKCRKKTTMTPIKMYLYLQEDIVNTLKDLTSQTWSLSVLVFTRQGNPYNLTLKSWGLILWDSSKTLLGTLICNIKIIWDDEVGIIGPFDVERSRFVSLCHTCSMLLTTTAPLAPKKQQF